MVKQRLLLTLSLLIISSMVLAKPFEYKTCATCGYRNPIHKHNEASYQKAWCKKAKIVLILDNEEEQKVYYERVKALGRKHKFDVEYVTNDILEIDEEGKCFNLECKCHRKKK